MMHCPGGGARGEGAPLKVRGVWFGTNGLRKWTAELCIVAAQVVVIEWRDFTAREREEWAWANRRIATGGDGL